MKKNVSIILTLALAASLCGCGKEVSTAPKELTMEGKTYTLTFEDEFTGRKLNRKKWEPCPEWERQDAGGFWDEDYYEVGDGYLTIKADIEDGTPKSGAIRSKGLFEQNQGYYEVKCRLQNTPGYWFAFWLMDPNMTEEGGNGAEDGAEIDIMESCDYTGGINHAIHWDGYTTHHKAESKLVYDPSLYEGFHTYSLLWTDSEYVFYIDGNETYRTSSPGMCQNALYLKLTAEFGSWAGDYKKGEFPSDIQVDYVRVYAPVK